MKVCNKCKQAKYIDEFRKRTASKDGRKSVCNICDNEYKRNYYKKHSDKLKKVANTWNRNNVERIRSKQLKYKYNLTLSEYLELEKRQNNLCAICKQITKLVVDHSHKTGKIRGLLCSSCNIALGFFKDDKDLLKSAIVYLSK